MYWPFQGTTENRGNTICSKRSLTHSLTLCTHLLQLLHVLQIESNVEQGQERVDKLELKRDAHPGQEAQLHGQLSHFS
jgi:hypothetical protein